MLKKYLLPAVTLFALISLISSSMLWHLYTTEKQARIKAEETAKAWEAQYTVAVVSATALQDLGIACLDREEKARKAAQEREAIMQADTPTQRTTEEKEQVVTSATRKKAATRLNRPLDAPL